MGDPIETVNPEGDRPDEELLVGQDFDTSAAEPEDEPLVGTIEDVENGSEVGWSD